MAKILLTEDDDGIRNFLAQALQSDGHEVALAEDGEEGLDQLRFANGEFDLLLTDIRMPIMDGIELAHTTAAHYPNVKILMMTGFADQREKAEDLNEVVVDVLQKPFSLSQIRESVSCALAA
jgi:DNA-binding NtrC family response regulator